MSITPKPCQAKSVFSPWPTYNHASCQLVDGEKGLFVHGGLEKDRARLKQLKGRPVRRQPKDYMDVNGWELIKPGILKKKLEKDSGLDPALLPDLQMYRDLVGDRNSPQAGSQWDPLKQRFFHAMVATPNKCLYILGGERSQRSTSTTFLYESKVMHDLWRLHLDTMEWEHLRDVTEDTGTLAKGIKNHSLIHEEENNLLIAFGGALGSGVMLHQHCSKFLYILPLSMEGTNSNLFKWSLIPYEEGPKARYGHAAWSYKGKMYVHGGYGGADLDDMWSFDPLTLQWSQIIYQSNNVPAGRKHHAICKFRDSIFMTGGSIRLSDYRDQDRNVYEFNLLNNRWTTYDIKVEPRAFHCMACFFDQDSQDLSILLHGGTNRTQDVHEEDCLIGPINHSDFLIRHELKTQRKEGLFVDLKIACSD